MTTAVKRQYRSPLREAQARDTRRAIVDAAGELFVESGYVATSVDAIAASAGVSRATVFNTFGSKAGLLKAAFDATFGEEDDRTPLIRRRASQPVLAERDPARYVAAYVSLITELFARVAPMYEVVRAAAPADPEVAGVWTVVGDERLNGSRRIVGHVAERGGLRPDVEPAAAADAVWVLNDPGLYFMLVRRRGWTPGAYRAWLTRALQRELL